MSDAGPHFFNFLFDIIRIHTLMTHSDIVEYNIVGDTKAALLRCSLFISKVTNEDIIATGQNMSYQNQKYLCLEDFFLLMFRQSYLLPFCNQSDFGVFF